MDLDLKVLGGFQFSRAGRPINALKTGRMQSLITYLALNRHIQCPRQRIASLFWPDSQERQARTNLRQLIHHLHTALPDIERYLDISQRTLSLRTDISLFIDVVEFKKFVSDAEKALKQKDNQTAITAFENAAKIYKGDVLPSCYDEWIEGQRGELRRLYMDVLKRLTLLLEEKRDYDRAIDYGEKLLACNEFDETTYQLLMRLYAQNSNRTQAMRIYKRCVAMLENELGSPPSKETSDAYEQLTKASVKLPVGISLENEIPFLGRDREWAVVLQSWAQAINDGSHVLLLYGDAGIGKTRLAQELIKNITKRGFVSASASCYAGESRLAYVPVIEWLRNRVFHPFLLNLKEIWQMEIARLLPELLEVHTQNPLPPLTESWQRQKMFQAISKGILSAGMPILLFLDDLHWADLETVEWLHYLLHSEPSAKILFVATIRSGAIGANADLLSFILELRRHKTVTELELGPFDARQTGQLAQQVSGKKFNDKNGELLFLHTEGNPLFIVEMARSEKWQSNPESGPNFDFNETLPQKIVAVIESRIAQISSSAQKLLQLIAVIGRVFAYDVLKNACLENEEELIQNIEELCQKCLIREQNNLVYDFSHDKIREVTLAGISKPRKGLLHQRVAKALEAVYGRQLDELSPQLAAHWEKGGLPILAIPYWERAGLAAKRIFANEEAVSNFRRALYLIRESLTKEQRDKAELHMLNLLSSCIVQVYGYAASDVQETGRRVLELCTTLHKLPPSPLLRMVCISQLVSGDIAQARHFGARLLKQAKILKDNIVEVEAYYTLGVTLHWQGRFRSAKKHLEKAIGLYSSINHHIHITDYAQDQAVICRIRLALVLWHLGNPLQAMILGQEALDISEELSHPFSRSYALHWYAWLHNLTGDPQQTLEHAERSVRYSHEYRFPYFATQSRILVGWALFKLDNRETGIQKMREGLSLFRATGSEIGCPYYRALVADALSSNGAYQQAENLMANSLKGCRQSGEGWAEAEILRLQANLFMRAPQPDATKIEMTLLESIQLARANFARMDALRAVIDLKQFMAARGDADKAHKTFTDVYRWAMKDVSISEEKALNNLLKH